MIQLDNNNFAIVESATHEDSQDIVNFMKNFSKIEFCDWQTPSLISDLIINNNAIFTICREKVNNDIIGVAVLGIMGTRATVNHIAVSEQYRKNKIGHKLITLACSEIRKKGVYRIFLFVERTHSTAISFWSNYGFHEIKSEITMEMDL